MTMRVAAKRRWKLCTLKWAWWSVIDDFEIGEEAKDSLVWVLVESFHLRSGVLVQSSQQHNNGFLSPLSHIFSYLMSHLMFLHLTSGVLVQRAKNTTMVSSILFENAFVSHIVSCFLTCLLVQCRRQDNIYNNGLISLVWIHIRKIPLSFFKLFNWRCWVPASPK